jgi:putative membrane protein
MKTLLVKWLVNALALFVVVKVIPGVRVDDWGSLLIAALVLGLLNAFLKPLLIILTLPVNILTLGLFTLVINGALFALAAALVKGVEVAGFGSALLAALVFSIVSFFLSLLMGPEG